MKSTHRHNIYTAELFSILASKRERMKECRTGEEKQEEVEVETDSEPTNIYIVWSSGPLREHVGSNPGENTRPSFCGSAHFPTV